jgi:hypothetical protein
LQFIGLRLFHIFLLQTIWQQYSLYRYTHFWLYTSQKLWFLGHRVSTFIRHLFITYQKSCTNFVFPFLTIIRYYLCWSIGWSISNSSVSMYLFLYLSIYHIISIYLPAYLSIYIYLCIWLLRRKTILCGLFTICGPQGWSWT